MRGRGLSLKVLLVDDEAAILSGLARILCMYEPTWDVRTASEAEGALEMLTQFPADVVVSDVRMPKMTGDRFLGEVRDRYPNVVRILLTGHADECASLRSIGTAHRFLCKPCQAELLVKSIGESSSLRKLLSHPDLIRLAGSANSLPAAPSLYIKLRHALNDPNCSADQVGDIVAKDVAMSAKVLQIVNSSFFGLGRPVSSPSQACMVLGTDTLSSIVAMADGFSRFGSVSVGGLSIEELQSHSLAVGALTRKIAALRPETAPYMEIALLAGLLHDAGKLLLASARPDYANVLKASAAVQKPVDMVERKLWGCGHGEVGGYLLGLWGLSDPIVEAVAFHHRPEEAPSPGFNLAHCVHLADLLCRQGGSENLSAPTQELLSRFELWEPVRAFAA